jgi:hypothetical protein
MRVDLRLLHLLGKERKGKVHEETGIWAFLTNKNIFE